MKHRFTLFFVLSLLFCGTVLPSFIFAASYTFDNGPNNGGLTGPNAADWADTINWVTGVVAGPSDDVTVLVQYPTHALFNISSNSGVAASVNTLIVTGSNQSSFPTTISIPITVANGATFDNYTRITNTITGSATFNDGSENDGTVTGNATFNDTSDNDTGTIGGNATFNNDSSNSGTVTGDATFNGSTAHNGSGVVNGNATFNGTSYLAATVQGNVTLNTTCYNTSTPTGGEMIVDGDSTCLAWLYPSVVNGTLYGSDAQAITSFVFRDGATNEGEVNADATFNDTSENIDTVNGDATFKASSINWGTVNGNAVFYENVADNDGGTVSGTQTRRYTTSVTTVRNFITDGADVVVADGAGTMVDISGATYDCTITFTEVNGGEFSPDPGCGGSAPTVTTQATSSVSDTGATANGNITSTGSANVTVRGFAYSTSALLSTVIATTTDTTGQPFSTGAFTGSLSSLTCNTTYYMRAYATNSVGTSMGSIQSFTTSACASSGSEESSGGGFSTPRRQNVTPTLPASQPPLCFIFTNDLEHGMTSKAVRKLQQFLNAHGYTVSVSGVGSLGNETYYFGRATERALARFQEAYATELLAAEGLTRGNGKLKSKTRKKTNQSFVNACAQTGTPIPSVSDPLVPLPEGDLPTETPPRQPPGWFLDDTETNRPPVENLTPSPSTEEGASSQGEQPASVGPVPSTGEVIDGDTPVTSTPDAPLPPNATDEPTPPTLDTEDRGGESPAPENILLGVVPMLQGILGTSTQALRTGSRLVAIALAPVADLIAPIGLAISLGAFAGTVVPIAGIPQSADIAVSLKRFWDVLLAALNIRRRRPWGVVYDSVTKRPLDPATITLTDAFGKKVGSSFTDLDGRYGFVVPPGTYRLEVTKANYIFPSQKLTGRTSDEVYPSLYFGGEITIRDNGTIVNNIPLDPVGLDWKEIAAQNTKQYHYYSGRARIFAFLSVWLFRVGFLLALYTVIRSQTAYDLAVLGVYALVGILRILGFGPRPYGTLTEHGTKNPLAFALVRVQEAITGEEVVRTVADNLGRYYALVENGRYVVAVEKKEADASYTKAYVSPVLTVKRGVINKSLVV